MASLLQHARRAGVALTLALGLLVLSGIVAPLPNDETVNALSGATIALADEPHDGG